jgi:hypothetical protein
MIQDNDYDEQFECLPEKEEPMQTQTQYNQILLDAIAAFVNSKNKNSEQIFFEHKMEVKTTPHNKICTCWGCYIDAENKVYLFDNNEQWNEITAADTNAVFVMQTLKQRLSTILN